jgi:hypothetical protein
LFFFRKILGDRGKSLAGGSSELRLIRNHKLEEARFEDELEMRLGAFGEDVINAITDFNIDSP